MIILTDSFEQIKEILKNSNIIYPQTNSQHFMSFQHNKRSIRIYHVDSNKNAPATIARAIDNDTDNIVLNFFCNQKDPKTNIDGITARVSTSNEYKGVNADELINILKNLSEQQSEEENNGLRIKDFAMVSSPTPAPSPKTSPAGTPELPTREKAKKAVRNFVSGIFKPKATQIDIELQKIKPEFKS